MNRKNEILELLSEFDGNQWGEQCLINGDWVGDPTANVINKLTGQVITKVPNLRTPEVLSAIKAAHESVKVWSGYGSSGRAAVLDDWANRIHRNRQSTAYVLSAEQGKPVSEAVVELERSSDFLNYCSNVMLSGKSFEIQKVAQRVGLELSNGRTGPVGVIVSAENPALQAAKVLGPVLSMGCTSILIPPIETPLTALMIGSLAEQAGLPPGVLNILTGSTQGILEILDQSNMLFALIDASSKF